MATKRARHGRRREQVLEAAARSFGRRGYAGVSMRELAAELGITAGALYKHFPSKLALFREVVSSRTDPSATTAFLMTLRRLPHVEQLLRALSLHMLESAREQPEVLRLLLQTSAGGDPAARTLLRSFRKPYVDFLADELARRICSGELVKVDPAITARCYVGLVLGCALNAECWNRMEDVSFDTLQVVENNVPIFARGLARPRAQAKGRPARAARRSPRRPSTRGGTR